MASDADIHRSTPGYVYGVGIASSRQEEGVPPCDCPCHVAERPRGASGWYCDRCYAYLMAVTWPHEEPTAYSHEEAIADGTAAPRPYMVMVPDYYFVTKGNTLDDELGEHFASSEEADARVKELNDADVIASLKVPRTYRERFDRFRELKGDYSGFGWAYGDGHPLTHLPRKLGRYALEESSDGGSYWDTYETMAEVEEVVLMGGTYTIVDLDTGDKIPFTLVAHFGDAAVAVLKP